MNRFSIATAILLAMTAGAAAADMSSKAPSAPTEYAWTGIYGGFNLGYEWTSSTDVVTYVFPPPGALGVSNTSESLSGYVAGGQLGYNWQLGNWVLGFEADAQGSPAHQINTTGGVAAGSPVSGISTTVFDTLESFGTVRGRIGFVFDRWMFYGTGGYAWQYMNATTTANPGPVSIFSNYGVESGWAAGAGIEVAFLDRWSAKLQYLHVETGTFNNTTGLLGATSPLVIGGIVGAGTTINEGTRMKTDTVQIGLNYRFWPFDSSDSDKKK